MAMESALVRRDRIGVQDFVLLEDYRSEDAFMENLKKRFKERLIYTYIGSVLISVNPYKQLDIYGEAVMEEYRGVNFYELPPHIFALADTAYRAMREEGRDQCVLISGESGAGKTEASKKILQYLAQCSGHKGDVDRVKDRLLKSNPVLEAFGNAKTIRNDNSSRFGKYMDIQFDFKGSPVGGHINNYLLEKSRVVYQQKEERNFHIFYQLLQADASLLDQLKLSNNPDDYVYLSKGECTRVDSINDRTDFLQVQKALGVLGFSEAEVKSLWTIVGAVLHMGDISFQANEAGHATFAPAKGNHGNIEVFATLLGIPQEKVDQSLTHKLIETKMEKMMSPLTVEQAAYGRDAMAKAVYERLFNWLVSRLNSSLENKSKTRKSLMGLLDIYGFEIFELNSFEQFCINFCNEKLQQLFIELTLKSEQEEYLNEGIEWEPVEYFNNKIICDLVEEKHRGIISVLDEECLRPGEVTDQTFLTKLTVTVGSHAHFITHETSDYEGRKTIGRDQFRLRHYAGDVTYNIEGFVDKNNDLLYKNYKEALSSSSDSVLTLLFPQSELASQKRPPTAGTQFKTSLAELMVILMSKEPSYVRCIKPNDDKQPSIFDPKIVQHQVKYLGLMENLRVRRAGFCYRRNFEVFLQRYKSLCPDTWPNWDGKPSEGVNKIFVQLKFSSEEYKIGKTKVFIKFPKTLFTTEDLLEKRKHQLVTQIIARWRCYIQQKKFRILKQAAITFQKHYRRHLVEVFVKRYRAAVMVQKHWKRWAAQRYYRRCLAASKAVRKFIKGFMTRNQPACPENIAFLEFVKLKFLNDLKTNLPRGLLYVDAAWPKAAPALNETSDLLKTYYRRYLSGRLMKSLTPEQKSQLTLKAAASDLFKGKKTAYPASVPRPFLTTHLSQGDMDNMNRLFTQRNPDVGQHKFSFKCIKYDRHGYKARKRVFIMTEKMCTLVEDGNYKMKEHFPFNMIQTIIVSSLSDGILLIRLPVDGETSKGDLILQTECIVEAVTKIALHADILKKVHIEASGVLSHGMEEGKVGSIVISEGPQPHAGKGKSGSLEIVTPSVSSS